MNQSHAFRVENHPFIIGLSVALAYCLGQVIETQITALSIGIPLVQLSTGCLLAVLILTHRSQWRLTLIPSLVLGVPVSIYLTSWPLGVMTVLVDLISVIFAATLINLMHRRMRLPVVWFSPQSLSIFLGVVVLICIPLSALGETLLAIHQPKSGVGEIAGFTYWYLLVFSQAVGYLTMTPLIATLFMGEPLINLDARLKYWIVVLITLGGWISLIILGSGQASGLTLLPLVLLLVPIVWTAFRVSVDSCTLLAVLLALLIVGTSGFGVGPLIQSDPQITQLLTQEFVLIFLVISFVSASYANELLNKNRDMQLFSKSLDSVREGVVISSAEGDHPIVYVNPAFKTLTGYQQHELLGKNCRFLNTPLRQQDGVARIREALKAGEPIEETLLNAKKDGTPFWNSVSISPIRDDAGVITHFVGIQQDVSEFVNRRQWLEQELDNQVARVKEERQRLELATEVSAFGIWEWDLADGHLTWDDRMHAIYETPEDTKESGLFYTHWQQALHPEDLAQAETSLQAAVEADQDWHEEFRLLFPDGRIKYIKAAATVLHNEQGEKIKMIGGNLDVTDFREMEQRLLESLEASEAATVAKSEFLANMSHEIRTPMNGVIGVADLLWNTQLSDQQKDYVQMMKSSAKTLLGLLNDILDLSKIESGKMMLDPIAFHLDEHLGDIVKGFAPAAHQKNVEINYFIDGNVPHWIELDPVRLGQIVFNLLGNAVKFTDQGEIDLSIHALPHAPRFQRDANEIDLMITVRDTGIGISEHTLNRIFDAFEQADGSITRRYGGTGLGLTIVTYLVDLMQGNLKVSSQEGAGTEFIITLPAKAAQVPTSHGKTHLEKTQLVKDYLQNCLVVDDSDTNIRWLKDMITAWGGSVLIAHGAKEALALIKQHEDENPVQVMLVDKNMPEFSGFDLVTMITEQRIDMPKAILMLSSSNVQGDVQSAKKLGISHYLVKPVKQSEVLDTILNALLEGSPRAFAKHPMLPQQTAKPLHVLVAEDNFVNQRLVIEILQQRGHEVDLAEDGVQALAMRKENEYDCILMDVQMPNMDGLEATRCIRLWEMEQKCRSAFIIGLTAHALRGDRERCLDAGMDDYLTKPVMAEELIAAVEPDVSDTLDAVLDLTPSSAVGRGQAMIFDEQKSLRVTGGNQTLLLDLIEKTLVHGPSLQAEILHYLHQGDSQQAAAMVHKLKGMVSNFTNEEWASGLKTLELMILDQGVSDEVLACWHGIEADLTRFYAEVDHYQTGGRL